MKIGIDARIYKTGIGRYSKNLLRELAKIDNENEYVVFLRQDGFNEYSPPNKRFQKILADYPPYSFVEQIVFLWKLWRQHLDLVHFTNFNVPILYPHPFVITLHDLIHMSHSTFGSSTRNRIYYWFKKAIYFLAIRFVTRRAKIVLAPSKATKNDVIRRLKVPSGKVVVTYEGFDYSYLPQKLAEENFQRISKKYGITKPYLLYVATMYPHKNHRRLIQALSQIKGNLRLVLVGKVDVFSKRLKKLIDQRGLSKTVIFPGFKAPGGYTPDEDLYLMYQNALAYIFPSLKEGFGIPILEAQALGVPVVCSNTSCLPEIAADSALYFDPYSVEDIADKINRITKDKQLRENLIKKGYQNVKRFSWQKTAEETLQAYQNV